MTGSAALGVVVSVAVTVALAIGVGACAPPPPAAPTLASRSARVTPPPEPIVLEGTCEPPAEELALDPDTTIGVVACMGDEHASTFDAGIQVRDLTYYLVRKRGTAIVAAVALGTWETGPEWGGSAQLEGVLRAGPRDAVAVISIAEYTGPDSHAAHAAVFRPDGASFALIYQHAGLAELAGNRATVADCVPSQRASPPGPCERLVNAQPRHTAISWNGTAVVESGLPVP